MYVALFCYLNWVLIRSRDMKNTAVSWPCRVPQKNTRAGWNSAATLCPLFGTTRSRFPSDLWACYGSLSWATASPLGHSAVTAEEAITAIFRDDPGSRMTSESLIPPLMPEPSKLRRRNEVAELAASSSAAVILISAELLRSEGNFWAVTLQIKNFPNSN